MKCRVTDEDLILYYYDELNLAQKRFIAKHLKECSRCNKAMEGLKKVLESVEVREPDLSEVFWQRLITKIVEATGTENRKRIHNIQSLLRPVMALLVLLVLALSGYQWYNKRQQQKFIASNVEMLLYLDLFENLEILEHLEDFNNT